MFSSFFFILILCRRPKMFIFNVRQDARRAVGMAYMWRSIVHVQMAKLHCHEFSSRFYWYNKQPVCSSTKLNCKKIIRPNSWVSWSSYTAEKNALFIGFFRFDSMIFFGRFLSTKHGMPVFGWVYMWIILDWMIIPTIIRRFILAKYESFSYPGHQPDLKSCRFLGINTIRL